MSLQNMKFVALSKLSVPKIGVWGGVANLQSWERGRRRWVPIRAPQLHFLCL